MQQANEAAAKVAASGQVADKGKHSDSYKLGALAQSVRLYLITHDVYDLDVINRLSAEALGRTPIEVAR